VTLLRQDGAGGLKVIKSVQGRWIDATPMPGALLAVRIPLALAGQEEDFHLQWYVCPAGRTKQKPRDAARGLLEAKVESGVRVEHPFRAE